MCRIANSFLLPSFLVTYLQVTRLVHLAHLAGHKRRVGEAARGVLECRRADGNRRRAAANIGVADGQRGLRLCEYGREVVLLDDCRENDEAVLCEEVSEHHHALLDLLGNEAEARLSEGEGEREEKPSKGMQHGEGDAAW